MLQIGPREPARDVAGRGAALLRADESVREEARVRACSRRKRCAKDARKMRERCAKDARKMRAKQL
eukprot:4561789-Pleurochrysis_carterae.AAC.1